MGGKTDHITHKIGIGIIGKEGLKAHSSYTTRWDTTHGYAAAGQRCYGLCDWHARGRTNVIGALIGKLLLTVGLFKTNVNADIFYQWIIQDLLPKLPSVSVVVMDNASFHKRSDISSAISNAGHTLDFLPVYSPDLNPIEKKWAHAKSIRRKLSCPISDLFKFESFYLA